jgi:DNA-binding transcriptional ArsR family regulator
MLKAMRQKNTIRKQPPRFLKDVPAEFRAKVESHLAKWEQIKTVPMIQTVSDCWEQSDDQRWWENLRDPVEGPVLDPIDDEMKAMADRLRQISEIVDRHRDGNQTKGPARNKSESPSIVLLPDDLKILGALKPSQTIIQYDLAQSTNLSRGTISSRLKRLRNHGLTYRPNGKRRGEAITEQGIICLQESAPDNGAV